MDLALNPIAAALPPAAAGAPTAPANGQGFSQALDSAQRDVKRDAPPAEPTRPAACEPQRQERTDDARAQAETGAPAEGRTAGQDGADAASDTSADTATTDAKAADAPVPPDLAALLPGWPGAAPARDVAAVAAIAARGAKDDLPLTADPRAVAARGRTPRDTTGANTLPLNGVDRALAGPAAATPAADTLAALRDARAAWAAPDAHGMPARPADAQAASILPALAVAAGASTSSPPGHTMPATATATATATPTPPEADVAAHIAARIDTPAFAPALGTTLSLLARDGVQQAQLSLHPAELGPVAVQITVDGNQARVDFHAAHAATRAALEASLPELAAALRDSGLTLTGGGVFDQPRQRQAETSFTPAGRAASDGAVAEPDEGPQRPQGSRPRGVVDLVA
jgi:flagellar hook-length control protein FliK